MKAAFGAGCFWRPQQLFHEVPGVTDTTVGYMGGDTENPSYEEVCGGDTGHVETVLVEYDEETISYTELLKAFWEMHDPTQGDRQGVNVGEQYRSVIFVFSETQRELAETSLVEQQKKYTREITTTIEEALEFYQAEDFHQHYYRS